jgi:hypothetical protein
MCLIQKVNTSNIFHAVGASVCLLSGGEEAFERRPWGGLLEIPLLIFSLAEDSVVMIMYLVVGWMIENSGSGQERGLREGLGRV